MTATGETSQTTDPALDSELLTRITQSIGELPPSPTVVTRVMGLTSDLNSNVEELGEVLAADAALTAKVLRLSNSSFYGRSRTVSSLREAILILGFFTLRSLVMASTTHSLYRTKENPEEGKQLWEHSLATAIAARMVADRISHPQVEEVFISGLLHDIGKLVLQQRLGDILYELAAESEKNGTPYLEIEQQRLGFTHAALGGAVLERWSLPPDLVEGVRLHHVNTFATGDSSPVPIYPVVNFGNELAKKIGAGYGDLHEIRLERLPLAKHCGLTAEEIEEMSADLQDHFAEEKRLYEEG